MTDHNKAVILAAISADVPVIVWGPPGCGKTAMIRGMAKANNCHVEIVIASQMNPEDVGGIPHVLPSGEVRLAPPLWVRRIKNSLESGRKTWVFFDEMSCARPDVQASLLRTIQERNVADIDISGASVIAAANHADYAASGGDLPAPTANRFAHVNMSAVPAPEWAASILSGHWPEGGVVSKKSDVFYACLLYTSDAADE